MNGKSVNFLTHSKCFTFAIFVSGTHLVREVLPHPASP